MIRIFDFLFSFLGLFLGIPVMLVIWIFVWFDNRSPLYSQKRVGRLQKPFVMIKFRTMKHETDSIATHLLDASSITTLGHFLRRTKLDELPQLWNVLKGDMSLVGPRPCLFNQKELIKQRIKYNAFSVRPGITGIGQLKGIDMSNPELLAEKEAQMLASLHLKSYFLYLWLTVCGYGYGDRIRS